VRDFLRDLNRERGTTILLTSHYMDDIEALCRRVMVIDRGQLYFDGELAALVERLAPMKQVQAVYAEAVSAEQARLELDGLVVQQDEDLRRIRVPAPRDRVVDVAACLLRLGPAIDLNVEEAWPRPRWWRHTSSGTWRCALTVARAVNCRRSAARSTPWRRTTRPWGV
jgi:ABC-2 type transport system ATP-binding protein